MNIVSCHRAVLAGRFAHGVKSTQWAGAVRKSGEGAPGSRETLIEIKD
jgi:hypothetical protein